MKTEKMLVCFFAVFFTAVSIFAQAQGVAQGAATESTAVTAVSATPSGPIPAELPMIINSGTLRASAYERAAEVHASTWSSSPSMVSSQTTYDSRGWEGRKTSLEILEQVKLLKLAGGTTSSSEDINVGLSVNDKDGDQLFAGLNTVKFVQVGGVWTLPKGAGDVTLVFDSLGIDMGQEISSAMGFVKDKQGNIISSQYVRASGRKVFFPPSLAVPGATLRVVFADGVTVMEYSTTDGKGKKLHVIPFAVAMSGSFPDTYSFRDPFAAIKIVVKTEKGVGVVPTIEVVMTDLLPVKLDVITSEGKRPLGFRVKSQLIGGVWDSIPVDRSGIANITLPSKFNGLTTYIVPEFRSEDLTEAPQPIFSSGGGGGGKGP